MHDIFTRIFEVNHWGNEESRSGPTSTVNRTQRLRTELPRMIRKFDVKTLFDAPCGDMNWMRELLKEIDVDYIGGDVVPQMIESHKADPELSRRGTFLLIDLTKDPLPAADMMLARDFLFHLSYEHTLEFMRNFAASNIPFLLTTSHHNEGKFENRDIPTGKWRLMDLFKPPYNFPQDPVDKILDGKNDRFLYLWTRPQVADAVERFGFPQ